MKCAIWDICMSEKRYLQIRFRAFSIVFCKSIRYLKCNIFLHLHEISCKKISSPEEIKSWWKNLMKLHSIKNYQKIISCKFHSMENFINQCFHLKMLKSDRLRIHHDEDIDFRLWRILHQWILSILEKWWYVFIQWKSYCVSSIGEKKAYPILAALTNQRKKRMLFIKWTSENPFFLILNIP